MQRQELLAYTEGSLKDTAHTCPSLHYLQLFSVQGNWYPICPFFQLLFVFHDLCFLFSAMSRSPPLWLSASQLSAVLLFEVLLFSVVDTEVGIQWEMERRNNIASFKTLVAFYVSLVKINSRKLEARGSCSLTKHKQPAEREILESFKQICACRCMFHLIVGGKSTCFHWMSVIEMWRI